jgi:hypothetical protein
MKNIPAFPVINAPGADQDYPGMTLRDYFAAKAMQAMVAEYIKGNGLCFGQDHFYNNVSGHAYRMADAMLRARDDA